MLLEEIKGINNIEDLDAELVELRKLDVDVLSMEEVTDLNSKLDAIEERRNSLLADIEAKKEIRSKIASHEVTVEKVEKPMEEEIMEEKRITIESQEYRDAFYAMISGKATAEQRAVLTTPLSVDGSGTAEGSALALPKALDEMIWDNIHTAHPILADIASYNTGIVMEVTKHTAMAARVAGKKDAATTAGAEDNTFVKVTLAGVDYEKYVELTYAQANMSQGALEQYLADEISAELGEALAKDVFAKILSDATTGQKVTATADMFADIKSALGKASLANNPVIYAPSAKYYDIVGAIASGSPFNIGATLGCEVKKDDAATCVTIVDPKQFVLNEVTPVMIESERDVKSHRVIVSGYLRAEGCLRKNKAAAYIA